MLARTVQCDLDRLRNLLDGGLPERVEAEIASHVESCATCRQHLETLAAEESWWRETRELLSDVSRYSDSSLLPLGEGGRSPGEGFEEVAARSSGRCNEELLEVTTTSASARVVHPSPLPKGEGEIPEHSAAIVRFLAHSDNPAMLGRLGEFDVLEIIGRGGMGIVLKGYDHELNRWVAIKVLGPQYAENGAARKRFACEAQAAAAVVHPHVIGIHAVDAAHQPPFFVMPFVPGESLQQRLDRVGPLGVQEVLRIGQQVADGLTAAHAQGLVHRDIKPANILLERNVDRVVITDFGLARAVDDASLTQSGIIAGTPQFMSPEQARGETVDARTDLFSFGSVLYAMLTGHPPFRANSPYGMLRRVTDDTPRPLREINSSVPDWLEAFVFKLLSKDRDSRWQSAREVADLLTSCLAHVQQPTVVALPTEVSSLITRQSNGKARWLIAAAAVLVVSAILRLSVSAFLPHEARTAAPRPSEKTPSDRDATMQREDSWDDEIDLDIHHVHEKLNVLENESDF